MSKQLWDGIENQSDGDGTFHLSVSNNSAASATLTTWPDYSGTSFYTYPTYYTWPAKIKLSLTEVEHLRKLARKDKALRETLEKFAPHIDIEVDFPGE